LWTCPLNAASSTWMISLSMDHVLTRHLGA
jgi:hypothetical protein